MSEDHLLSLDFSEICEIDLFLLHLTIYSPSDVRSQIPPLELSLSGLYTFYKVSRKKYWFMIKLGLSLLAGPSGHAYLGSCFEMTLVRMAMLEMLRPDWI